MRIVGGTLKGQTIRAPKTAKTRPITDKDREALFNILGDVGGLRVLDAYAGSGSLGLEALSRGASFVDAVELAKPAASAIASNVKALGLAKQYHLNKKKLTTWLGANAHMAGQYNLIFADPPFDALDASELSQLDPFLASHGMLVLKHPGKAEAPALGQLQLLETRRYGDSALSFYRQA